MITKNRILLLLGILIALVPFLGFPSSYENVFQAVFGIFVAAMAFLYARDKHLEAVSKTVKENVETDVYSQNGFVSFMSDVHETEEEVVGTR